MRDYKGWTAKERLASLAKTKAAIAAGTIPPPTKCNRCGKTTGRIDYHNHDYSDPIKYLEQLCQGCHTRLHRLENKALSENIRVDKSSTAVQQAEPALSGTGDASILCPVACTRKEMQQIRIAFTKAIGLDWSENPNPNSGYKFEHNLNRRQQFLNEALRLRDLYAEMVNKTGRGKDIQEKMESNLINRDRKAVW